MFRRLVAFLLGALGTLLLVLWLVPITQTWWTPLAILASFISYAWLSWAALVVVVAIGMRHREKMLRRLVVLLVALALAVGTWVPLQQDPGQRTKPAADSLRVLMLNTQYGYADAATLLKEAKGADADVVVLLEYTPDGAEALAKVGWSKAYPHMIGQEERNAGGTAIFSRTPIEDLGQGDTLFTSQVGRVRKGHTPWTIAAVHPVSPFFGAEAWAQDGAAVRDLVKPHIGTNLVVIGDFNATPQHHTMFQLQALQLRNAAMETGLGDRPTWPKGYSIPPMIRIDHALVGPKVQANLLETFDVARTDHRGLFLVASPLASGK